MLLMNKRIFEKINEQFDKDLTPNEFIATSRLAIAFQKAVAKDLVDKYFSNMFEEN